jgi:hypothetical protein
MVAVLQNAGTHHDGSKQDGEGDEAAAQREMDRRWRG